MMYQFPPKPPPDVDYIAKPFTTTDGFILFDYIRIERPNAENPIPILENSAIVSEASR